MPTISIFIRKDDLPKWKALDYKSEWLHKNLNSNSVSSVTGTVKRVKKIIDKPEVENIKINADGTISARTPGKPSKFIRPKTTPSDISYKKTNSWGA